MNRVSTFHPLAPELIKANIAGQFKQDEVQYGIEIGKKAEDIDLGKSETDELEKGGEGSKGGKAIGHTKSGKPVYEKVEAIRNRDTKKSNENTLEKGDTKSWIKKQAKNLGIADKLPAEWQKGEEDELGDVSADTIGNRDASVEKAFNDAMGVDNRNEVEKAFDSLLGGGKKKSSEGDFIKGGEGSKGGKVIGHTKSGKPVYELHPAKHQVYKNFTAQDHYDASDIHGNKSSFAKNKEKIEFHDKKMAEHWDERMKLAENKKGK